MTSFLRHAVAALVVGSLPGIAAADIFVGPDQGSGPVRLFQSDPFVEGTSFDAFDPGFAHGQRVALGDIDNDGLPDFIVAAGAGSPLVQVFSGADNRPLRAFYAFNQAYSGGVSVASGDLNGDGHDDIVTGTGPGVPAEIRVFDGATGAQRQDFFPFSTTFTGGVNVAVGDVNCDGHPDIIAGAGGFLPEVKVFSGLNGGPIADFFAFDSSFSGGVNVAAADFTGDGHADIVVGAASQESRVRVFDGATLTPLGDFFAYEPDLPGGVRVAAADVNGDGVPDLVTAPGPGHAPLIKAFDGASQSPLAAFFAYGESSTSGVFVAAHVAPRRGQVEFTEPTYKGREGHHVHLHVRRVGGSVGALDVPWHTQHGSAKAGRDYVAASGVLHWDNGDESERDIDVDLQRDRRRERREHFTVELQPAGAEPVSARVTIVDVRRRR